MGPRSPASPGAPGGPGGPSRPLLVESAIIEMKVAATEIASARKLKNRSKLAPLYGDGANTLRACFSISARASASVRPSPLK